MSRAREFADLAGSADAGGITGPNLIINGNMTVSQRGTTFADLANGGFGVDRFIIFHSDDGAVTVSQDTTVPAGQGFKNSMKFDVTTADTSIAAAQYYQFAQKIEGQNMAHLEWGTSNAKSVTLSFWIRSNLTGTYNVYFLNNAVNRYHPVNFTIDSANTWEKKIITVAGDTSGTWLTTNGVGMFVLWNLALGSNYLTGTNATWGTAGPGVSGTTQANFLSSTSNELYITGVQLEVGEQATPFEHRSIGDELIRCQRYYVRHTGGSTNLSGLCTGVIYSSTAALTAHTYSTPMRSSPTIGTDSLNAVTQMQVVRGGAASAVSVLDAYGDTLGARIDCTITSGTTGQGGYLQIMTGYVDFDAEL